MRSVTDGTHRGGYPAYSPWQAHIGGAVGLISGSWSRAPSGKRRGDLDAAAADQSWLCAGRRRTVDDPLERGHRGGGRRAHLCAAPIHFPLLCHASDAAPQLSNYAN